MRLIIIVFIVGLTFNQVTSDNENLIENAKSLIQNALNDAQENIEQLNEKIQKSTERLSENIKNLFGDSTSDNKNLIENSKSLIQNALNNAQENIEQLNEKIQKSKILDYFSTENVEKLSENIKNLFGDVISKNENLFDNAKPLIQNALNDAQENVEKLSEYIKNLFGDITSDKENFIENAKSLIQNVLNGVQANVEQLTAKIQQSKVLHYVSKENINKLLDNIKNIIKNAKPDEQDNDKQQNPFNIEEFLENLLEKTETDLDNLIEKAKDKASEIMDTLKETLGKVLRGIAELRLEAKSAGEKTCVDENVKNIVKEIGEFYKSPPTNAQSVRVAIEESKKAIRKITNQALEVDIPEAKKSFEICNKEDANMCEENLKNALNAIIEKAKTEFANIYGNTGEEIDNSVQVVDKWLKSHHIYILDNGMNMLEKAQLCVKKQINEEL